MVITPSGPSGLSAVRLVEEVHRQEQGIVPIPLQSMAEMTAVNWDNRTSQNNATTTPVVSFTKLAKVNAFKFFADNTKKPVMCLGNKITSV